MRIFKSSARTWYTLIRTTTQLVWFTSRQRNIWTSILSPIPQWLAYNFSKHSLGMPLLRWNVRFTRYVDLPCRFFVLPSASPRGLSHLHDLHLTCYDSLCRRPYILPMRWVQTRRLDQWCKIIYLKQGRASRRSRLTESGRKGFRIHAPNQVIKHGVNTRAKLRPEEGILYFEKDLWTISHVLYGVFATILILTRKHPLHNKIWGQLGKHLNKLPWYPPSLAHQMLGRRLWYSNGPQNPIWQMVLHDNSHEEMVLG